jgi:hypothetical protein
MTFVIEKNPVKLAYYDYLMMRNCAERYVQCSKDMEKITKKFSEEQMWQYIHLIDGTLKFSDIKEVK